MIDARADGGTALAESILAQVQPGSPINTVTTFAACIDLAVGLLDDRLTGPRPAGTQEPRPAWASSRWELAR